MIERIEDIWYWIRAKMGMCKHEGRYFSLGGSFTRITPDGLEITHYPGHGIKCIYCKKLLTKI